MAITYPLIQFGSVYSTADNLSGGTRYIVVIQGLDGYQLTDNVQAIRALDGTIYNQYQTVKDVPITITFPRIDTTKYDAIRDVMQAAITGETTFALNVTGDMGTFTFTAKPQPNPIGVEQSEQSGYVENFQLRLYVSD